MSPVTATDLYTALYLSVRHREISRNWDVSSCSYRQMENSVYSWIRTVISLYGSQMDYQSSVMCYAMSIADGTQFFPRQDIKTMHGAKSAAVRSTWPYSKLWVFCSYRKHVARNPRIQKHFNWMYKNETLRTRCLATALCDDKCLLSVTQFKQSVVTQKWSIAANQRFSRESNVIRGWKRLVHDSMPSS